MGAGASEVCFLTAAEQARLVRGKDASARELAEAYLDRIEALDPALGAYLARDREGALARADEIDRAVAAGEEVGPLGGVPLALKDIFVTEGLETTAASKILGGWIPPYNGTAVARLRRAGAVFLGKTNMDEFAMGSSNEHSGVRPCRNPWDTGRVPGGSSGGSAAAVAAGLAAGALGTDTGGSIRQPAAHCGVVGIKPTYGRVSRYGVIAFASSLDQVGPIARTVEDAALLLEAVAGFDPQDATSIEAEVPRYSATLGEGVRGMKIGLPKEYFSGGVEPEVSRAVEEAVKVLEREGARPVEVSLPHSEYALPAYYLIAPAEASSNLARYDGVRYGLRESERGGGLRAMYEKTRGAGFGPEVKRRIMLGTFALRSGYYEEYYGKAQKVRALVKRDFDRAFEEVDAIVSPTSPTAAFSLGAKKSPLEMYMTDVFTLACNLAGLPGMSVPCGFTAGGLPIGMQVLGRPLGEETLFRVGAAYERATDWGARRPPEASK